MVRYSLKNNADIKGRVPVKESTGTNGRIPIK